MSGARSSNSNGSSTLGGSVEVPNPKPDRSEQEQDRNLDNRYQVSGEVIQRCN